MTKGFARQSKKQQEIARLKGLEVIRSPELKRAWKEKDKIRDLYASGVAVKDIAVKYKINWRTCYRIVNDKT